MLLNYTSPVSDYEESMKNVASYVLKIVYNFTAKLNYIFHSKNIVHICYFMT